MKRILLVLMVMAVVTTGAFAQWVVGADLGLSYLMEDWSDYDDINQVGFPFFVEVGYELPYEFEFGDMGMSTFTVGGKLGYVNNIVSAEDPDFDYTFKLSTIPFFLYGRAEAQIFYVELGLGLHAWVLENEFSILGTDYDYGDNGLDTGVYLGGGLSFPLSDAMALRAGLNFTKYTFDFDADDESDGNTIGVNVGLTYKL